MFAINKIATSANAEGWDSFGVKKALNAQIKADLEKAIKEWENSFNCYEPVEAEKVVDILTRECYAGAYMYAVNKVTPGNFQAWCSTNAPSKEGDIGGARNWVNAAPVGEEVHYVHDRGNGKLEEKFQKTTNGWVRTFYMYEPHKPSEKNGPWLTAGLRERVAKRIGAPLSSTFQKVFNDCIEELF